MDDVETILSPLIKQLLNEEDLKMFNDLKERYG